ncbi:NUDIX domain-containing protein [Salinirubellus sp. GCM10025818]
MRGSEDGESMTACVSQKAVVFDSGGMVLVLRDAGSGDWEFPGGRIDRGERPMGALHREMREETALSVDVDSPVFTATKRRGQKRSKFFVYYLASTRRSTPEVTLSDEHSAARWVAPPKVPGMNRRRRTALERALARRER